MKYKISLGPAAIAKYRRMSKDTIRITEQYAIPSYFIRISSDVLLLTLGAMLDRLSSTNDLNDLMWFDVNDILDEVCNDILNEKNNDVVYAATSELHNNLINYSAEDRLLANTVNELYTLVTRDEFGSNMAELIVSIAEIIMPSYDRLHELCVLINERYMTIPDGIYTFKGSVLNLSTSITAEVHDEVNAFNDATSRYNY